MGFMLLFQLPLGIMLAMPFIGFMPFHPMPLKLPWFGGNPKPGWPIIPFAFMMPGFPDMPSLAPSIVFGIVLGSCEADAGSTLRFAFGAWGLPPCSAPSVWGAIEF
jgi:hypothetical protein